MVAPRPCRHFRAMFALLQEAIVQPTPWHWVAFSFAIAACLIAAAASSLRGSRYTHDDDDDERER